jgi:hypothetical protein
MLFFPSIIMAIYVFLLLCRVGNGPPLSSVAKAERISRMSARAHSRNSSKALVSEVRGKEWLVMFIITPFLLLDSVCITFSWYVLGACWRLVGRWWLSSATKRQGYNCLSPPLTSSISLILVSSCLYVADGFVVESVAVGTCGRALRILLVVVLCGALFIGTGFMPQNWESLSRKSLIEYVICCSLNIIWGSFIHSFFHRLFWQNRYARASSSSFEVPGATFTTKNWTIKVSITFGNLSRGDWLCILITSLSFAYLYTGGPTYIEAVAWLHDILWLRVVPCSGGCGLYGFPLLWPHAETGVCLCVLCS